MKMKRWLAMVMALCLLTTCLPTRIAAETMETVEELLIPETTETVAVEETESATEPSTALPNSPKLHSQLPLNISEMLHSTIR